MLRLRSLLESSGLFIILFAILGIPVLRAQVDTGAVLGVVKDPSGAVIPGAKVTLADEGTGLTINTTTGPDGTFTFTPIKIGTYTVTAEFQGFREAKHLHVSVNIQQQVVVDFTLQPGEVTQTIEVTSAPPLLQTQSGALGQVVGTRDVNDLPLNGRNFTFLAQLVPGANFAQHDTRGLGATGNFSVNGMIYAQNNYLLDGIDNNNMQPDYRSGTSYAVLPPPDAIQEFKVQTSAFTAELGRAGGAVLNATTKSGTNQFHGDAWEFVRNDTFDAADFFENAGGLQKSEFRRNQFGGTLGGPIEIPHVYNGRNKTFFFVDYQGTRIRQGIPYVSTVPTAAEKQSGYTNFSDLITLQPKCTRGPDLLGRTVPCGTIFDPATTRTVQNGQTDPVTHLVAEGNGYVRDPFPGNVIPVNRLDPNAIKLLQLLPSPNSPGLLGNYADNPVYRDDTNQFDAHVDHNFSARDTTFGRLSWSREPGVYPGPFPGIADGDRAVNGGILTNTGVNAAWSETHSFSATAINEFRLGYNRLRTTQFQPFSSDLSDIPAQHGILGIPQLPENGGLPRLLIGDLNDMGSNTFLPVDKIAEATELLENATLIHGSHTFKTGFQFEHFKFTNMAPPYSRGQFTFNGTYTSIPNINDGSTGIANFLISPVASTVKGGINFVGGATNVNASNFFTPDYGRNYYGLYFQDDWKVVPKLTLNLGLRWEYFGLTGENHGAMANFVPAAPFNGAAFIVAVSRQLKNGLPFSSSFSNALSKDGVALQYSSLFSLGTSQLTNFAPRFGLAYQLSRKLVLRGGYGIFYGGFEDIGGDNLGSNYPFIFRFSFPVPDPGHPITYANGTVASLEAGFTGIPLTPTQVNAEGLSLFGMQYHFITPYTQSFNLTLQDQITPNQSFSVGYVGSQARHLLTNPGQNQVSELLPPTLNPQHYVPFPDFGRGGLYDATEGSSGYNSLQTSFERRFSQGVNFLADYTWSKCRTDLRDRLVGNIGGYRAAYVPGAGIQYDYALCDMDVRQVAHVSGGYELPFGPGHHLLANSGKLVNAFIGGWRTYWILTLTDGQPFTVGCNIGTAAGLGCNALLVPGANPIGGPHNVNQWVNPSVFTNPQPVTAIGQTNLAPLGGAPTQAVGPGFHRLDFSLFKEIRTTERTHLEFRAEVFNLTNTPNFANPAFLNFGNPSTFGRITSTRDNPNDPRQIQLALKFYW